MYVYDGTKCLPEGYLPRENLARHPMLSQVLFFTDSRAVCAAQCRSFHTPLNCSIVIPVHRLNLRAEKV